MALKWPKPGVNDTAAYQLSGIPFIYRGTAPARGAGDNNPGLALHVKFDNVTRDITIINKDTSDDLRISFTASGSVKNGVNANHYLFVDANTTSRKYNFRCKELFFISDHASNTVAFELIASTTNIPTASFPTLTGSNSDYLGVG